MRLRHLMMTGFIWWTCRSIQGVDFLCTEKAVKKLKKPHISDLLCYYFIPQATQP